MTSLPALPEPLRPPPVPQLQQLARTVTGEPRAALRRLLMLVCEQLAMDIAFVATLTPDGARELRIAVTADGTELPDARGRFEQLAQTWCGSVVRDGSLLVNDAQDHPALLELPSTRDFDIASYAGVALLDDDGTPVGTLCALGHSRHGTLNDRDRDVLVGLGEVVAPLLRALDAAPPLAAVPASRSATDLASLADLLTGAADIEQLARPLLDALHELTGLASAYLTVIHDDQDLQEIRFSRNTRPGFTLPEGLHVPWGDTLCKRALDEGRACTTDVPQEWGDSQAGIDLGIQVYVSVPVALSDGRIWGTLCAADSRRADGVEAHLPTMRLFARLISAEVERDLATTAAATDMLTGCSSRRSAETWLARALDGLGSDEAVALAYVDVDRFKAINDGLGHAAGDAVLVEVARQLRGAARPGDLIARLGGDEFVVAAVLPRAATGAVVDRVRAAMGFSFRWLDQDLDVRASVGSAVSDGHDAAALLAVADGRMYADKRVRA